MNYNYKITYFKNDTNDTNDANDTNYRKDIINVFNLNDMFDSKIDDQLFFKVLSDNAYKIYLDYKDYSQILNILTKLKDNLRMPFELTNDALFMYLFRFDLFHLFHKCLIDLKNTNKITEPNFQLLMNSI